MKKRQIGVLGIIAGQVATMLMKEKKLRTDVKKTPSLWGKISLIAEKRWETNENLFNELKDNDRAKTSETLEKGVNHDIQSTKDWVEEQKNKDREEEGRSIVRNIKDKIPSEEDLKKTVDTYTEKVKNRRDKQ